MYKSKDYHDKIKDILQKYCDKYWGGGINEMI